MLAELAAIGYLLPIAQLALRQMTYQSHFGVLELCLDSHYMAGMIRPWQ